MRKPLKLIAFSSLQDRIPVHSEINGLDLVLVRYDENVSVLYASRCSHGRWAY